MNLSEIIVRITSYNVCYTKLLRIEDKLPILLVASMILFSIIEFLNLDTTIAKLLVVFSVLIFAYYGLDSLNNRKRPIFDVTLLYWSYNFV